MSWGWMNQQWVPLWISLGSWGVLLTGCGSASIGDCQAKPFLRPCSQRTVEEEARLTMNDHDYVRAVELLVGEIAVRAAAEDMADRERYALHPLLAAAYAGRAGFSTLDAVQKVATQGAASGTTSEVLKVISDLAPRLEVLGATLFAAAMDDLKAATTVLGEIPETLLQDPDLGAYGESVTVLKTIYGAVYVVMVAQSAGVTPEEVLSRGSL